MSNESDWQQKPPTIENPEEAAKAQEILSREPGVPRGHADLSEVKPAHTEEIESPPHRLDDEVAWCFPACAYCMVGLDRSLFELYSWHKQAAVPVTSYRTDKPIAQLEGVDISRNPWFHTIQGIDMADANLFREYIESYEFRDHKSNLSWRLHFRPVRIADPFFDSDVKISVAVYLLLPECITTKRRVVITREPGLALQELRLGVRQLPKD